MHAFLIEAISSRAGYRGQMSGVRAKALKARHRVLAAALTDTERQLAELRTLRGTLHDDDEHDPDGVPLSSEWSRLEGLRVAYGEALGALEKASARLGSEGFGRCSTCGGPIDPARLEARPEAITCISCAT